MGQPLLSFVIATYNRRAALQHTFAALEDCGLPPEQREIIVVDNNSDDGTRELLEKQPGVRPILLNENLGSCAKAIGAQEAKAPFLLFLDDDSYPRAGCVHRMLSAFERFPKLGAAGHIVRLPNGQQECSALPHVFVGCGVGLRARAVQEVGGLDDSFFMQAEEYDLTFRLLEAGYEVERFADLQVEHLKTPTARVPSRRVYYDIRNNLRLVGRYLPDSYAQVYRHDWYHRYQAFAKLHGHLDAFHRGQRDGLALAATEREPYRKWRLGPHHLESVFAWKAITAQMHRMYEAGYRRIGLVDLSKNLYAFHQGAAEAGLQVVGVYDDALGDEVSDYRGTPVLPLPDALGAGVDALVVSNCSYVHAQQRARWLRTNTNRAVFNWFVPPRRTTVDEPQPRTLL